MTELEKRAEVYFAAIEYIKKSVEKMNFYIESNLLKNSPGQLVNKIITEKHFDYDFSLSAREELIESVESYLQANYKSVNQLNRDEEIVTFFYKNHLNFKTADELKKYYNYL